LLSLVRENDYYYRLMEAFVANDDLIEKVFLTNKIQYKYVVEHVFRPF